MVARRRWASLAVLGVVLVIGACSGDDGDEATATSVEVEPPEEVVLFDLLLEGHHECIDEPGDVTVSTEADQSPPVPMDGVDLLAASVDLEADTMSGSFDLVGPPDPASDPASSSPSGHPTTS